MSQPTDTLDRVRFRGQPIASTEAIVTQGNARFTILTSRLIRIEWSPQGRFEDHCTYAFPTRLAKTPQFTTRLQGTSLVIDTGALQLHYSLTEEKFNASNLAIHFSVSGIKKTGHPA